MQRGKIPEGFAFQQGVCKLLAIKDSDIRISILRQGNSAIDKGIHIGGAFSAVVPLVSLYYGSSMVYDVEDPTNIEQDILVLSKGHAVAALASIYADVGYIDPSVLKGSRSRESILNGHPGPILPGISIATGPLGQGLAVAQGFALAEKQTSGFDVFVLTGDGELQEGIVWETFMFAPQKRLDNLCVLIDKNEGQLDTYTKLHFSMDRLGDQLSAFGWRVIDVDATGYGQLLAALSSFTTDVRDGRPLAIICHSSKGAGAFSQELNKHKITLDDALCEQEVRLQDTRRKKRKEAYMAYLAFLSEQQMESTAAALEAKRKALRIPLEPNGENEEPVAVRKGKVMPRDKRIFYDPAALPIYRKEEMVSASDVITRCMKVFAKDPRVVSIDADLGTTSGLQGGVGAVDQNRAINVGIAEANMMCIGEAFAVLGYNTWVSTFCPFFDWKVLRRIAVGQQEREESMADPTSWLSEGHGLDITFLATAANLDTQVNGATHMGNDDNLFFSNIAGLKIIDVSCPNQLVSIMKWIMEGNKGLVYLRIMRSASHVLYDGSEEFSYQKAWRLFGDDSCIAAIISSGRGTHEALTACRMLKEMGIAVSVYDMPSFDAGTMKELLGRQIPLVIAEQNNGFLWQQTAKLVLNEHLPYDPQKLHAVNLNRPDGSYRFIHSATYGQLIEQAGLDPSSLASLVKRLV